MIYVYAFVERSEQLGGPLRGLQGAPVEPVAAGDVVVACSRHEDLALRGDVEELWQHEAVTADLLPSGAVVPARFGTVLGDEAAVRAVVAQREESLVAALRAVRGKVELGVRGQAPPQPRDPEAAAVGDGLPDGAQRGGRSYLRGLAGPHRYRGLGVELAAVHAALTELAERDVVLAGDEETLSAAYLIDGTAVEDFTRTLVEQRRLHPGIRVSLTGPWAPYHFVDQEPMSHV